MKLLVGSIVFSVAFLLGLFAVGMSFVGGLSDCVVRSSAEEVLEQPRLVPSRPAGGVMVLYAGPGQDWDSRGLRLKFVIVNGSADRLTYRAVTPTSPTPTITVNGTTLHTWECQFGNPDFVIRPGDSAEVYVYPHRFKQRPRSSDQITVGFYLQSPLDDSGAFFASEEFRLPEEFIAAIATGDQ